MSLRKRSQNMSLPCSIHCTGSFLMSTSCILCSLSYKCLNDLAPDYLTLPKSCTPHPVPSILPLTQLCSEFPQKKLLYAGQRAFTNVCPPLPKTLCHFICTRAPPLTLHLCSTLVVSPCPRLILLFLFFQLHNQCLELSPTVYM